jgi:putative two-component system response regulator
VTVYADMRVLIVDDNRTNIELVEQILHEAGYRSLLSTQDPEAVARLCEAWRPDLVLLDLHMPGSSGFEVMGAIRGLMQGPEFVPVLVVTADATPDARYRALAMGARDFITKPIDQRELLLRTHNLLHTRDLHTALQERNAVLDDAVRARTAELDQARLESLALLAAVGEYHDDNTHVHTQRVGASAAMIAEILGLPDPVVRDLRSAAPLHDIGKIGIPQGILRKPGALTAGERTEMQRHVEIGSKILSRARSPVLVLAAEIALTHHEWWDGAGYPRGLAGEDIPTPGRITALADVFDALTHPRPYKVAWPVSKAVKLVRDLARRQFDPRVVDAFLTLDPTALRDGTLGEREASFAQRGG